MGSGKTTLGKRVAKKLGMEFVDTDKVFSKAHGSISEFFKSEGELAFRSIESKILEAELSKRGSESIVATGGGIVTSETNRNLLKPHFVVFLDTNADQIASRLSTAKRPLLTEDPGAWERIYQERLPWYEKVAKRRINTANRPISKSAQDLEKLIHEWRGNEPSN